jgi:hypothetical protein
VSSTHLSIDRAHDCDCKDDKDCHCFTLKHHPRRKTAHSDSGPSSSVIKPLSKRRGSTNLRPVLPKPTHLTSLSDQPTTSILHSSSDDSASLLAPRPHLPRSTHGSAFFSPYGRAYNEHLVADLSYPGNDAFDMASLSDRPFTSDSVVTTSASLPDTLSSISPLPDFSRWSGLMAPMCACGDGCSCPGCVEHRGASAWFTRDCANPDTCTTCFTSLTNPRPAPPPAPTPPTTPLGARSAHEYETLYNWFDNMSSEVPFFPELGFPNDQRSAPLTQQQQPPPVPPMDIDVDVILGLPPHCTGLCAPGQCTCLPDNGLDSQRDSDPLFNELSSSMLPPVFDLDMGDSSFSLPDIIPRGRSQSFPFVGEGGERTGLPKASSTTSLLPMFALDGSGSSLMPNAYSVLNDQENTGILHDQTAPSNSGSHTHRRSGSRQRQSLTFFEAAARRIR